MLNNSFEKGDVGAGAIPRYGTGSIRWGGYTCGSEFETLVATNKFKKKLEIKSLNRWKDFQDK
jgi:hypothetical protein